MLQQTWCGLCTTPPHTRASHDFKAELGIDPHGAKRAVELLGGAGSARSQVRARANENSRVFPDGPLGVRVGVAPRRPPEVAPGSSPGAAKTTGDNASFTVGALRAYRAERTLPSSRYPESANAWPLYVSGPAGGPHGA